MIDYWNQIKIALLDTKISEIVLVLNKPHHKRPITTRSSTIEISQFACNESEAIRFTAIIKLVSQLAIRLPRNQIMTRRDFYYQDVNLFQKSQSNSNNIIDLMAHSLEVSSEVDLLIYPSQKGLMYGNCTMHLHDNKLGIDSTIELNYTQDPILIPHFPFKSIQLQILNLPDAIVIIEKESVFKSFCDDIKQTAHANVPRLLVITGKGFPDHLTREFVSLVSRTVYISTNSPPVLGFMDSDVYGISIFKNYVYGDKSQFDLQPPSSHNDYRVNMKLAGVMLLDYTDGWLDISTRDTKIIQSLLNSITRQVPNTTPPYQELAKWHRELTRGLMLRKKLEMNVVNGNCNEYIWQKINLFILKAKSQP